MRVKIAVVREMEIEVNDPIVAELDAFWRSAEPPVPASPELDEMVSKAVAAVEKAVGLPFGDENAPETILNVCALDGEPIIEW